MFPKESRAFLSIKHKKKLKRKAHLIQYVFSNFLYSSAPNISHCGKYLASYPPVNPEMCTGTRVGLYVNCQLLLSV